MHQVYQILPCKKQLYSYVLQDLDIPEERIDYYTSFLECGNYLLVINSTKSQVRQIQFAFNYLSISNWQVYHKSEANPLISSNFDKVSVY